MAYALGEHEMGIHAPFISSPISAIAMALAVADVSEGDVVYDLGCGDGRVAIIAAKHLGAYSKCVEIQPDLCALAEANALYNKVSDRVSVICKDFFDIILNDATVVYTYLYTSINQKLSNKFEKELPESARIVTLDFPIPDWVPFKIRRFYDDKGYLRTVWLYIVGLSNPRAWRV